MSQKPSIPQGTRDFGPEIMVRREFIFGTIREAFRLHGFQPLETPAMEKLSVLTGKYGEEGDQLIFKILNNGDFLKDARDLDDSQKLSFQIAEKALRYDLTVPFARYVVMNAGALSFPFKRYQIQPVWRGDRPGKGRYREFYQCDADVVGSDSLLHEAELISIFDRVLSRLGLPAFRVLVNNRKILSGYAELIGQPDKMVDLCTGIDKLDKIGPDGVVADLGGRGIGEAEARKVLEIIAFEGNPAATLDYLDQALAGTPSGPQGVAELREVFRLLAHYPLQRAELRLDPALARGLSYYTGAIFEVKALGVQIGSICGGGRYADLTGVFGAPGLSGVGISFGADRIYDVMEALNLFEGISAAPVQALVANFGEESLSASLSLLHQLRAAGISSELYPEAAKLKKQFAYADKKGIPWLMLIGSEEAAAGSVQVKHMASGEQQSMPAEAAAAFLQAAG